MASNIYRVDPTKTDHTPASAVSSGDVVVDNGRVLIATDDIAASERGVCFVKNVVAKVTKASGTAWSEGDEIYYDATNANFEKGNVEGGVYAGLAERDAGSSATTAYLELNAPRPSGNRIPSIKSDVLDHADFTDNGDATGYIDVDTADLPAGALPQGWKIAVTEGFTGDTTAVVQVGVAGDLDRFSAVTDQSVLATGTVGSIANTDAADGIAAAQTIRITVTGGADWGSIAAGKLQLELFYLETTG